MGTSRAFSVIAAFAMTAAAGCSSPTSPDSASTTAERCAAAEASIDEYFAEADRIAQVLRGHVEAERVTVSGSVEGFDVFFASAHTVRFDRGIWQSMQEDGRRSVRTALRVIVNEPECFEPDEVAEAEDALTRW